MYFADEKLTQQVRAPCHHVLLHAPKVRPRLRSTPIAAASTATAIATLLLLLLLFTPAAAAVARWQLLRVLLMALAHMVHPPFRITPAYTSTAQHSDTC